MALLGAELVGTETVGPEPVCIAMDRRHSPRMGVAVRELMELFLQSRLVAGVSAPAFLSHCRCPGSEPAPLGSPQTPPA